MAALPPVSIGECVVERTPFDGARITRADPVIKISLQLIQRANADQLRVDPDGCITICGEVLYRPETVADGGCTIVCRRVD